MDVAELEHWLSERAHWLQEACRRVVKQGQLTEKDYVELLVVCKQEATGGIVVSTSPPKGFLTPSDTTSHTLRLVSISDLRGINALSPSKPLEFGTAPLFIVYGRNGSGKSGYVRVLKHACGAKCLGELYPNVFSAGPPQKQARLVFSYDAEEKEALWFGSPITDLLGVDIYDTACGLVYVNEENEVTFEPWPLRLFTQLTAVCEEIKKRLQAEINVLAPSKPQVPEELLSTSAAAWYESLSATTPHASVTTRTNWTDAHEQLLSDITKRLAEPNPEARSKTLARQQTTIVRFLSELEQHYSDVSDQRCQECLNAKDDAAAKRKAIEEDAKSVFASAPLEGVGTKTWRLLWEAARRFSIEQAYLHSPFPNVDAEARCVLCQQTLDEESRLRFSAFEKYIKGELQQVASEAQESLEELLKPFQSKPEVNSVAITLDAAGIEDEKIRKKVIDFVEALARRKQTVLDTCSMEKIDNLPCRQCINDLSLFAEQLQQAATQSERDAEEQNRPKLQDESRELRARKWLHEQLGAVNAEITRLIAIDNLQNAVSLTNTTALSKRKSILADDLITSAYVERFKEGLRQLKAHEINVTIKKTRTKVGKVYHQVLMENAQQEVKTSEILSEGEFRIVSLAAFLADTEGRGSRTPFVFDDPISSLDHVYEEETARRLCELSQSRQVIVFTHRLSLVGLLQKYAEKYGTMSGLVCLSQYKTGDITEIPINFKRTDHTVNTLIDHRIPAARKALEQGDEAYICEATTLCHDIRVLLERTVESDLLNGIIKRFSQEVNTKNRIHALAKITEAECKLIDDMLTKYSRFEHSQPEEAPVLPPKPDEIEQDLIQIKQLVLDVRKRNKP